jgi:hypothetical protein
MKKMHARLLLPEYDHLGPFSTTDVEKVFNNIISGQAKGNRK